MHTVDLTYSVDALEALLPPGNSDGQFVTATEAAANDACAAMGLPNGSALTWHLPDVFSVRYGSAYAASAVAVGQNVRVRFLADVGDLRDGDDQGWAEACAYPLPHEG